MGGKPESDINKPEMSSNTATYCSLEDDFYFFIILTQFLDYPSDPSGLPFRLFFLQRDLLN